MIRLPGQGQRSPGPGPGRERQETGLSGSHTLAPCQAMMLSHTDCLSAMSACRDGAVDRSETGLMYGRGCGSVGGNLGPIRLTALLIWERGFKTLRNGK